MQANNSNQRLYWSLSRPLKYMGLTIDEWSVALIGGIPGLMFLNSGQLKLGVIFLSSGVGLCYGFKKFKKLSEYFVLKSYLVGKGFLPAPKYHPNLLNKRVGK